MCGFSIVDWRFGRLVQEFWILAAFHIHVHFEIRVQSGSNKHSHCLGMALTTIFSKLVHKIEFLCLEKQVKVTLAHCLFVHHKEEDLSFGEMKHDKINCQLG